MKKKNKFIRVDDEQKIVTLLRQFNPPTHHARFKSKLREEYPGYKLLEDFKDA